MAGNLTLPPFRRTSTSIQLLAATNMTRGDGKRENQHYVPKLLLRNFISNPGAKRGSERIWAFNKETGIAFNPNIRGIAAQFGFYDLEDKDGVVSFEGSLCVLEDRVKPALDRIMAERSLANLTAEDRGWLPLFCAIQFLRVEQSREMARQLNEGLVQKIVQTGGDPARVDGFKVMDEADVKTHAITFMMESARDFADIITSKCFFLMEAPEEISFYIGDNPLVMHNRRDLRPYGNIGLAVPGIEIYLPVSPWLTVAMWDPTNLDEIAKHAEDYARSRRQFLLQRAMAGGHRSPDDEAELERMARKYQGIERLLGAARTGGACLLDPEEVTFANSLQVKSASKFVMSARNDFSLAQRMISDNPKYRSPPRIDFG
jgi:hypothetical protein